MARQHGHCSVYGNCGQTSKFGPQIPCPADVQPQQLDAESARKLEALCGAGFSGATCCTGEQVDDLQRNLAKAGPLLESCPACKQNFYRIFCDFACSPDQAQFVEVVSTEKSLDGRDVVSELNYYIDPTYADSVYTSCAEVKFSATNGRVMDLIGGGAHDYQHFFAFLGDKKPMLGGSPFQINFPWPSEDNDTVPPRMERRNASVANCGQGPLKCSCVDCPTACPELPPVKGVEPCSIMGVGCGPFFLLLGYLVCILVAVAVWRRSRRKKVSESPEMEIQRLIDADGTVDDDDYATEGSVSTSVRPYWISSLLQSFFVKSSFFCARFPLSVITLGVLLSLVLSLGVFWVDVLKTPGELWVGPNSQEYQEKVFFDENFGPFYRTAQIFAVNNTGPILQDYSVLEWWFEVEQRVNSAKSEFTGDELQDFCYKPIDNKCVIQSLTQYFGGDIDRLPENGWQRKVTGCADSPVRCLPPFQQPISPQYIFGPYNNSVLESHALVSTWVLNNDATPSYTSRVQQWENALEHLLKEISLEADKRGIGLSYSLESSMERELGRSSTVDIKVIVTSYLLMFLYVAFTLGGRVRAGKSFFVTSKLSLGLFGVLIALLSVSSAIGFCAIIGVKMTLIITEVILYLILAVGVDNIFLIVHYLNVVNDLYPQYTIEERVSEAMGLIGPSIVLSSTCEIAAISMGFWVEMPAVRNFAIYSAIAIVINTLLQLTVFVAALSLDQRRIAQGRVDCFPCIRASSANSAGQNELDIFESQEDLQRFSTLVARDFAPFLFRRPVKRFIVPIFTAWVAISLSLLPRMEIGLDQRLAVPSDSFLVNYFTDVYEYLQVGPPVYFVADSRGVENRMLQQKLCSRFSTCDEFSLVNILEQERKRPEISYIGAPAASWIDDFMQWLNPDLKTCCLETPYGDPCLRDGPGCDVCYVNKTYNFAMDGFPEGSNFSHYLDLWLKAPSTECALAGKAPYQSTISRNFSDVVASTFRTMHTPLRSQQDYIDAYANSRRICDSIEADTGVKVFPYSIFYVFFAQYRTLFQDTFRILGSSFLAVFVIATVLLGSPTTAGVLTMVVIAMLVNIGGLMVVWGVSLNALSLVNLLICVGIGVEFCVHIARSYTFTHKVHNLGVNGLTKTERAFNALTGTGGTVFGGIALTKIIGVLVLAFASSQIFVVYYFRMWLALILCATLHSLVLLPVALSYWGGKVYTADDFGLVDQFGDLDI